MYEQVEKKNENNSRTIAKAVRQKKSNLKQGVGFVDNRPESVVQRKLQEMANRWFHTQKTAQFLSKSKINSSHIPIQCQVPVGGEAVKPNPESGTYKARGGKDVIFDKDTHTRANFQFGSKTRYEVFYRFNPQFDGNRITSVLASNGEQMNTEAIQLDHHVSWGDISNVMHINNQQDNPNWQYTFWDAKMYYNDQVNLHPAPASLNAAAGEEGVERVARLHYGLEAGVGTLQTAWMNLQQTLSGMSSSIGETAIEPIWERLNGVSRSMNLLSNDLANSNW